MIDWSTAPNWAKYHSVDSNGAAYWWESKPEWDGKRWVGWPHPRCAERTMRCAVDGGTPGTLIQWPGVEVA